MRTMGAAAAMDVNILLVFLGGALEGREECGDWTGVRRPWQPKIMEKRRRAIIRRRTGVDFGTGALGLTASLAGRTGRDGNWRRRVRGDWDLLLLVN